MYEEQFDEWCDNDNPRTVTFEDVLGAYKRISGTIINTPCIKAHLGQKYEMDLFYKAEFLQFTGNNRCKLPSNIIHCWNTRLPLWQPGPTASAFRSMEALEIINYYAVTHPVFKERGVCNVLSRLTDEQKKYGIISASLGNHSLATAYHTWRAHVPSYVVMPSTASPRKISQCRAYIGDRVILTGNSVIDSKNYALKMAKEKNMLYVNGFDHPDIIGGQGTCGIEILAQIPDVDAVLVPVGGGGLISGIAIAIKHLKPQTEVYGVATNKCYAMAESLRKNERVSITIDSTVADGLAVDKVGVNAFHNIKNNIDKMIIVKEEWVMRAIMEYVEGEKLIVEGGGATALAVIMAGLVPQLKGKKVVCVVSGGNIDNKLLCRVIERSLGSAGRLIQFKVVIPDQAGAMAQLSSKLAKLGVTMRDFTSARTWVRTDVYGMEVKIVAETTGPDHVKQLKDVIKKTYKDYFFHDDNDHSGAYSKHRPASTCPAGCQTRYT